MARGQKWSVRRAGQMGAENSILLCRGSNALRRVRWKRGKLRPCVAYHEIRLEVEEQRPNGARDGRVGERGCAALGHTRCMYLEGHSFTAGCCGGEMG
jgi:hypothetical protein